MNVTGKNQEQSDTINYNYMKKSKNGWNILSLSASLYHCLKLNVDWSKFISVLPIKDN